MIKPYFSVRDTLLHVYDIILKGDRIFVLKSLRTKVLEQWHLGNDSLLRRARDTIFGCNWHKTVASACKLSAAIPRNYYCYMMRVVFRLQKLVLIAAF